MKLHVLKRSAYTLRQRDGALDMSLCSLITDHQVGNRAAGNDEITTEQLDTLTDSEACVTEHETDSVVANAEKLLALSPSRDQKGVQ